MTEITAELLDKFPFARYASTGVIQRGGQYFRQGKTFNVEFDGKSAYYLVEGSYDEEYDVYISLHGSDELRTSCTCPHAQQVPVCKHIVASILALRAYLLTEHQNPVSKWEQRLSGALENLPQQKGTRKPKPYLAVFFLSKVNYYRSLAFSLSARVIKSERWFQRYADDKTPEEWLETLQTSKRWHRYVEQPYRKVNPAGCLNLSPEGVAFFHLIMEGRGYYGEYTNFAPFLPLLAQLNAPIFLADDNDEVLSKIEIQSEPVEIKAALVENKNGYMLQAGVERDGQVYSSAKESLLLVNENPPWVLVGENLVSVTNPESLEMLSAFPLQIPTDEEEYFRQTYLAKVAEVLPIESDLVSFDDVDEEPVPRLYLRKERDELVAQLRFGYGNYETPAEKQPATVKMDDLPGSWTLTRIYRRPEREAEIYGSIKGKTFGLKRAGSSYAYGEFVLRARTHPYDFLTKSIPALTEAGFEIYGDKDALGKLNRNTPTVSLNITSGIDWFDLDVKIQYGDQEVKLKEVRQALKRGENFIKLADGSIGQIPEQWLERYKHLFNMSKET